MSVNATCTDSRGLNQQASTQVTVENPPPPAKNPEIELLEARLALHSIYYPTAQPATDKPGAGLVPSQQRTLQALATDLKTYLQSKPDAHLILEGHADSRGAKDYNTKLSERRVERARSYLVEKGVPADQLEVKAFGFEKNMTSEEVKKLLDEDPDLAPAEKQKLIKNLVTVRMANNRRVDVTLSTTGEQSVRRFPFSAKDALTLLSRGGGEKGTAKAPAPKAAAPKTAAPKKPATP